MAYKNSKNHRIGILGSTCFTPLMRYKSPRRGLSEEPTNLFRVDSAHYQPHKKFIVLNTTMQCNYDRIENDKKQY